jgi:transcriptional antiterminator RfaH
MSSSQRLASTEQSEQREGHPRQWFCVQTKPRYEDFATFNLVNKAITVYSPKVEELRVRNHKNIKRVVPLFPSYIFARLNLLSEHDKVRWTPGVKQILRDSRGPIYIEDEIIDGIAAALKNKKHRENGKLKMGDAVAVSGGAFSGLNGVFQYYSSGEARVKVLLDLIYRQVVAEFDTAFIRKV